MPIDYSSPNFAGSQRDAITQALMNIAMPPPPTSMPQQYGAAASPQVAGVQGPIVPSAGGGGAPAGGTPAGQMGSLPGASGQMGGMTGVQGPTPPGAPAQSMPMAPGMGRAGLPQGPMPKTPNLVGQPLGITQPGTQLPPPNQGY